MMKYKQHTKARNGGSFNCIAWYVGVWNLELTTKQYHTGTQLSLAIRSLQLFHTQQFGMTAAWTKVDVRLKKHGGLVGPRATSFSELPPRTQVVGSYLSISIANRLQKDAHQVCSWVWITVAGVGKISRYTYFAGGVIKWRFKFIRREVCMK